MAQTEMINVLKAMTGETNEEVLFAYLQLAADKILARCYPFDPEKHEVPARYVSVQIEVTAYLLNKRGAEGENRHAENGIDRSWESASVPDSMLKSVVPFAKVFGGAG